LQRNAQVVQQEFNESEARREFEITAPQDGIVAVITASEGQAIDNTKLLASLLPDDSLLEAEVFAASRAAGFIRPGMKVLLRYQAYPYQKFGQHVAWVEDVAQTSLRPEELNSLVSGHVTTSNEPLYRIKLRLENQSITAYGKSASLKSGMVVDASVILEKRKLYEWILEPLFSISGRF
jgi:membrane fusion protein